MPSFDLPRPFGPYTLLRRLASGGMAEVYLAKSEGPAGFEKLVAVKRIHPQHANDDGYTALLLDEARLSASLSHRNIVQTLDLERVEDSYLLVMEHVDGYDAHHVLESLRSSGRRFPIDLAAHVIAELCCGLDYAHQHRDERGEHSGIVHRDVSPQNLLLSFAGEVKIADFGIAKATSRRRDSEAGVIKGKYFYMSPEQAWAEPLDHRSDIFSAGVVFWELLTGRRLHEARDVRSLVEAVRRAEVPLPSSVRKEVPEVLDAIVGRATALNPAGRYGNADEMGDALAAYLAQRPPLDASRQLGDLLAGVKAPSETSDALAVAAIPQTRDRVPTQSAHDFGTPAEPTLRYDLEEGRRTAVGRRRPPPPSRGSSLLWLIGAAAALVGLVAWALYGR